VTDLFVSLHTHTHASTFDGFGKESQFAERISDLGQPALGVTEHGTMRGIISAQKACDEAGVKLIPGIEAYLCDNIGLRGLTKAEKDAIRATCADKEGMKAALKGAESRRRDRDHVTMWAMNEQGLKNLYKLSTIAWNQGFYYKPRLDIDVITAHHEGVIITTGCPGGVVSKPIREGRWDVALERFERLLDVFGDRFYVEIMPHIMDDCEELQHHLLSLASSFGVKVIATQDAHYPEKQDAFPQEVLVCIQTRQSIDDPDRFSAKVFSEPDFYLRTREEMEEAYGWMEDLGLASPDDLEEQIGFAADHTVELAERCTAKFVSVPAGAHLVAPDVPEEYLGYDEWLVELVLQGFEGKAEAGDLYASVETYEDRLDHELLVLEEHGFASYFIMVWDVIRHCRANGIRVGPGRGSAAGSLVSYFLGITSLDPVRHGLSFERFIAPGRKDLPDIDTDIQNDRRQEAIQYLRDTYGDDRVAGISTSIAMRGRRCLRDSGRVFGVPIVEIEKVASVITDSLTEEDKDDSTVGAAIRQTEVGKKFAETYPDVAEAAERLEGNLRDVGAHAAGIVVSPEPLIDLVPLESRRSPEGGGRIPVVAFDMDGVEETGLVKGDWLGLKTMRVQAIASEIVGMDPNDLDSIPLDDDEVLQAFTDGRFGGIFQFDSPSARRLCKGFNFKRFGDIPAMTALNRPGPMKTGLAQAYLDRSEDPSLTPSLHPVYDEITEDTYGVLVYQEQIMALAADLAGYTPVEAFAFLKKVSKKKGISDEHAMFVEGAVDNDMDEEVAERLFNSIIGFGSYAFNKSHATAYGLISYQLMWLKVHHPGAFFTGTLEVRTEAEDLLRVAAESARQGIPVRPPDVNESRLRFTLAADEKSILGSVAEIKNIGVATAAQIATNRPYESLKDLYDKTRDRPGATNLRTFRALAQSTALRSVCRNTKLLVENAEPIWKALQKGFEVDLDPDAVDDYERDQLITSASESYRLFVDESGRGEFDAVYDKVVEHCERELLTPAEVPTEGPDSAFVLGRLNASKLYAEGGGTSSARVSLLSPDGIEIVARADSDVLGVCSRAIESTGKMVLSMLYARPSARGVAYSIERMWTIDELLDADPGDMVVAVARPARTKPKNPLSIFHKASIEKKFRVRGMVLRVRKHADRRGAMMRTVGLLGQEGYLRFFVWSSRCRGGDMKLLRPGRVLTASLKKLSGDACVLTDRPLSEK
jgi:DNA polymerase-3 subunit alpha